MISTGENDKQRQEALPLPGSVWCFHTRKDGTSGESRWVVAVSRFECTLRWRGSWDRLLCLPAQRRRRELMTVPSSTDTAKQLPPSPPLNVTVVVPNPPHDCKKPMLLSTDFTWSFLGSFRKDRASMSAVARRPGRSMSYGDVAASGVETGG